jgi:hypothetical protein
MMALNSQLATSLVGLLGKRKRQPGVGEPGSPQAGPPASAANPAPSWKPPPGSMGSVVSPTGGVKLGGVASGGASAGQTGNAPTTQPPNPMTQSVLSANPWPRGSRQWESVNRMNELLRQQAANAARRGGR